MHFKTLGIAISVVACSLVGCGTTADPGEESDSTRGTAVGGDTEVRAAAFLKSYLVEYEKRYVRRTKAAWNAATTGTQEAFEESAQADLALRKLHSDPDQLREIQEIRAAGDDLDPLILRALEVAELDFRRNQLSEKLLEEMAVRSSRIEQTFNTFRATMDDRRLSNNELLDLLAKETDSKRREVIWSALKQVGAAVAPELLDLARIRNRAARQLGFEDYWHLMVVLGEHEPERLLTTFAELARLTDGPFRTMKQELDGELARKFEVAPDAIMPWHYDNPFFQAAPPSEAVDLDEFYRTKDKEEIAQIAIRFFASMGLPIDDIVDRSDLYEREGKDQHAFCEDVDRRGDVRMLLNIRPTAEWMDTMLHESGHAVYDKFIDRSLPFNIREANHIFTTEGVAMLFGSLAKNPEWIIASAGADPARVREVADAIREQRRREQLIFCRWTLVMLHFERALYADPDQDLNRLWWDLVEKYQFLRRPEGRDAPDWAAKPHFTIAPVYYHNYQLGELFAAQLRAKLAEIAEHEGPSSSLRFSGRTELGRFLREAVFFPGSKVPWPRFVEEVTGKELTARYFADEL